MKDDRRNTLSHDRYQQKQGYQTPKFLPVFENNHSRPNLALIGIPMVRWACPDGIGNNLVAIDNWTSLHQSQVWISAISV